MELKGSAYQFSSFPEGSATARLKGQLLKLHPQLTWTLVLHPNKEAKKHRSVYGLEAEKGGEKRCGYFTA